MTEDSFHYLQDSLTPKRIVEELDKYIIGQDNAKRSVAIALRNRWRRQQVPGELQAEISPSNTGGASRSKRSLTFPSALATASSSAVVGSASTSASAPYRCQVDLRLTTSRSPTVVAPEM